jgi:hypothetical protein
MATLALTVSRPVRYLIQWGTTDSYELGNSLTDAYRREFVMTLRDLEPGTAYQVRVTGLLPNGQRDVLFEGVVETIAEDAELLVPNVRQARATIDGTDVALFWQNPAEPGVAVRVLRSPYQFPLHPTDGQIVYQGDAESVRDPAALAERAQQYYTIFARDSAGNFSTGVILFVAATEDGVLVPALPATTSEPVTEPTVRFVRPDTKLPGLGEITISQSDRTYQFADPAVRLSADRPFVVRIPVETVATHLKSIVFSYRPQAAQGQWERYLLRRNEAGTAYVGYISAPKTPDWYEIALHIYDFEAQVVGLGGWLYLPASKWLSNFPHYQMPGRCSYSWYLQ